MRRVQLVLAPPLLALFAAPAEAKQVGIEGGEVVARFDPGDSGRSFTARVDRAAGTIVARDGGGAPGGVTVRAGAGCSNDPPPFGGGTVTCPLAGGPGNDHLGSGWGRDTRPSAVYGKKSVRVAAGRPIAVNFSGSLKAAGR